MRCIQIEIGNEQDSTENLSKLNATKNLGKTSGMLQFIFVHVVFFETIFKTIYVMSWRHSRVLSLTEYFHRLLLLIFQVLSLAIIRSSTLVEASRSAMRALLLGP